MMKGGVGSFSSLENLEMIGATMGKSVAELEALREEGRRDLEDWKRRNCTPEDFERGRKFLEYLRSTSDGENEAETDADEAGRREGMLTEEGAWLCLKRVFVSRHRARLKSAAILASKARLRRRRAERMKTRPFDEGPASSPWENPAWVMAGRP